jgi:murein L,D-transpeptidase YafK
MSRLILLLSIFVLCSGFISDTNREKVRNATRVREAYASKEKIVKKNLTAHAVSPDSLRIYLRAFKTEKILELWAKNSCDTALTLVKEFPICEMSGSVGPKRRHRDLQVPEGFYYLSELNPYSKYYLSIKVNYPNASDSIRGSRGHLGNNIFIHGQCLSSGCIAITNERISELFVYCLEAYNAGQEKINITIYPARLKDAVYTRLINTYPKYKDDISLWKDLKSSFNLFERSKVEPVVKFLPDGTHEVK